MINDLGYGYCPRCKKWAELTRFHPHDKKLARKDKRRICASCAPLINAETVPFFRVKKAIANHKVRCKEGDYTFTDLLRLHTAQGCKCAYCEDPIQHEFSLEHIIPVKFGGRNLKINIVLICPTCNSSKQHFELIFWIKKNNLKLRERIMHRVRGAYDYHGYEFTGDCTHCYGEKRPAKTLCTPCSGKTSS
jgi:5-methylcytosine-specific restriction endonuclease McrA